MKLKLTAMAAAIFAGPLAAQDEAEPPYVTVNVPVTLSNLTRDTFGVSIICFLESADGTALGDATTTLLDTSREFTASSSLAFLDEDEPDIRELALEGFSGTVQVFVSSYNADLPIDAWAQGSCELRVLAIPVGETDRALVRNNIAQECGATPSGTASYCELPGSNSISRVTFTRPGFGVDEQADN